MVVKTDNEACIRFNAVLAGLETDDYDAVLRQIARDLEQAVAAERERIAAWVKWRLSGEGATPGMGSYPDDEELGEEVAAIIKKGVPWRKS